MKKIALFSLLLLFSITALPAQTSSADAGMVSTHFDMTGFPQWSKDLRRFSIIAFGSFPFAYLVTNISFDTYRYASHGGDRLYAPWPMKPAAAIEQTKDEKFKVIGISAGGAALIALVDYGIVRYKRSRLEREIKSLPPGTPIITRRPLYGEEVESPGIPAAPAEEAPPVPGSP